MVVSQLFFPQMPFDVSYWTCFLLKGCFPIEPRVQSLGGEDPLEKGMATHFTILAWRIPWIEKLGGLQFMGHKELDIIEWLTHTHKLSLAGAWTLDGETVETVSDFIFGGSKITADSDYSHEINGHLLLGRKVMTNIDSILKSRDTTLPTKIRLVKAMVFPVVMYGCESWTVKKAEHQKIDAFELWC